MNKTVTFPIVISSDKNYIPHVITLLSSIEVNVKGKIEIYMLCFSLDNSDKKNIQQLFPSFNFSFIDLSEYIIQSRLSPQRDLKGYMSYAAYARLLIPELLPVSIKKCLYLDVDGIILKDLMPIWDVDISDYCIGGIKDTCNIISKQKIGLDYNDVYINSGFIIFNLEKCRQEKIVSKFVDFINYYEGKVWHMDQGVINGSLQSQILLLPINYNVLTPLFFFTSKTINKFYCNYNITDKQLKEARENPLFVHFTKGGTSRPWENHCKHPYKNKYWEYRLKKGLSEKKIKDNRNIKLRFFDWIIRHFPLTTNKIINTIK